MAKINNQSVMQKLIDELKLYPGKDIIPTELAEKILPVFQINDQEVTVQTPVATWVKHGVTATTISGTAITMYTAPSTGKCYLTNVGLQMNCIAGGGVTTDVFVSVLINEVRCRVACIRADYNTTFNESISFNFQNPILVDAGSTILFDPTGLQDGTAMDGSATVVGYDVAD